MSFKITHILYSFIGMIVALFFVFVGIVMMMLPLFPGVRFALTNFIMEDSLTIFFFGLSILVVGIAYIAGIIWGSRRKHYQLRSGKNPISISDEVFHDYLNTYWKRKFPNKEIPCTVKVSKNRLHISADFPYIPLDEQKKLIVEMQEDLTDMLTRLIGAPAEYVFSLSFNEQKRT